MKQQDQVAALLKKLGPTIEAAFLAAIRGGGIDPAALINALQRGDIDGAAALLRIDRAALFPLEEAVRGAYLAGASAAVSIAPRAVAGSFSFNGRHFRAERWVQAIGSTLIQGIQDDTLAMARAVILDGVQQGSSPARIQRDLTGTYNRATGQREGGFLGTTAQQADSMIRGRAKLASGDPALMKEYLDLKLRDRRFDPMIKRYIADGKAVSAADLDKIMAAHKSKALKYRGQVIAKNEAFSAQAAGRNEAYLQMAERPDVAEVTVRWQHNLSQKPREDHVKMDGTVIKLGEKFDFGGGVQMAHPHDPAGGAEHSIGCRCVAVYRLEMERD